MNINNVPKSAIALNSQCSSECRNKIIKLALSLKPSGQYSTILDKLTKEYHLSKADILQLVGLYLLLNQCAVEFKATEFHDRLVEIGFSPKTIEELPFYQNRESIVQNFNKIQRYCNNLTDFRWRIDISLSDRILAKKVPKNVIMCLELQDGQKYTISMDIQTFHQLRYNIALMINDLKTVPFLNK